MTILGSWEGEGDGGWVVCMWLMMGNELNYGKGVAMVMSIISLLYLMLYFSGLAEWYYTIHNNEH